MGRLLPKKDQERLSLHRYLNAQESNVVLIKGIMDSLVVEIWYCKT